MFKIYEKTNGLKVAIMPRVIVYAEELENYTAIKTTDGSYHEVLGHIADLSLNLLSLGFHNMYVKEDGMYILVAKNLITGIEDCGTYRAIHFFGHAIRVVDRFENMIVEQKTIEKAKEDFAEYFNYNHFNFN